MSRITSIRSNFAAARSALLANASSSRVTARPTQATRRSVQTSQPLRARYERFDPQPQWRAGPSGGGPGGGGSNFKQYLRRRLGGDRAIYIYGIGLGGGGLYYVTQSV
jgi:hypothetical protein